MGVDKFARLRLSQLNFVLFINTEVGALYYVRSIAKRIGYKYNKNEIEVYSGFLIDDLECCTKCDCAVESKLLHSRAALRDLKYLINAISVQKI